MSKILAMIEELNCKPWITPPLRNAVPVHDHDAIMQWNAEVDAKRARKAQIKRNGGVK